MKIGIIPLGRDTPPTEVIVSDEATVAELKKAISSKIDIETEDLRISYLGNSLDDDKKDLTSYGISDGAIVNIIEAPPGGQFIE